MSSGALECGSRAAITAAATVTAADAASQPSSTTTTTTTTTATAAARPASLRQVPTSVAGCSLLPPPQPLPPPHWRNVHCARLDKISGQCLWNACKALAFGIILLLIGATMATIGYYADSMSMMEDERRGNVTIKVRNFSKQLHMLSYLGPCIMGLGGFVLVAACVMTFEARDSAAKVVPQRFRGFNGHDNHHRHHHHHHHLHQQQQHYLYHQKPIDGADFTGGGQELCVLTSNGTTVSHLIKSEFGGKSSWDQHSVHRPSGSGGGGGGSGNFSGADGGNEIFDRHALTTAFIEFSHNIQRSIESDHRERILPHRPQQQQDGTTVALKRRCPSAPDLMPDLPVDYCDWHSEVPRVFGVRASSPLHAVVVCRQESNFKQRLQVNLLPRQAISVDNPNEAAAAAFRAADAVYRTPSDTSMTMDLHLPDCPVTLTVVKDDAKSTQAGSSGGGSGSETSVGGTSEMGRKRRPLLRQRQVERHPDSDSEDDEAAMAAAAADSAGQAT